MPPRAGRARRHAMLAQWLDTLPGEPSDELLGERARHWATAAELNRELGGVDGIPVGVDAAAAEALNAAMGRAAERELHSVELRWADRLLDLVGEEPSPLRRRALLARAAA